jgi:hypothetical protein
MKPPVKTVTSYGMRQAFENTFIVVENMKHVRVQCTRGSLLKTSRLYFAPDRYSNFQQNTIFEKFGFRVPMRFLYKQKNCNYGKFFVSSKVFFPQKILFLAKSFPRRVKQDWIFKKS